MTDPRTPNYSAGDPQGPWAEPKRSRGPLIASIVLAVIIVVLVAAAAVWFFTSGREGDTVADEPDFAVSTSAQDAGDAEDDDGSEEAAKETTSEETRSGSTTVTETATTSADSDDSDTDAARQHRRDRSNYPLVAGVPADKQLVPQCDGRAVLIVQSVMGNSGNVAGEINAALAGNPGAVVYPPGVCPSIRASVGGAEIHPVVVDYGNNLYGLCAAEAAAGDANVGNARILDQSANQESPC